MSEAPDIPGAEDVVAWFGYWPTFHDAEVVSISLDRARGCVVSLHVLAKHATVTFGMEGFPADESGIYEHADRVFQPSECIERRDRAQEGVGVRTRIGRLFWR